jgi:hypothetical protein
MIRLALGDVFSLAAPSVIAAVPLLVKNVVYRQVESRPVVGLAAALTRRRLAIMIDRRGREMTAPETRVPRRSQQFPGIANPVVAARIADLEIGDSRRSFAPEAGAAVQRRAPEMRSGT